MLASLLAAALLLGSSPAGGSCRPSRAWASAGVLVRGAGAWNLRVCPDGQFEANVGAEDQHGRLSPGQLRTLRQLLGALPADGREREFGEQHPDARMLLVSVTAADRLDYAVGDDLRNVRPGGACDAVVRVAAFLHGLLTSPGRERAIAPWFPPRKR